MKKKILCELSYQEINKEFTTVLEEIRRVKSKLDEKNKEVKQIEKELRELHSYLSALERF